MTTTITAVPVAPNRKVNVGVTTDNPLARTVTAYHEQYGGGVVPLTNMTQRAITVGRPELCEDFEILFGTPITYSASVFDAAGKVIETTTGSVSVTVDEDQVWLRDTSVPFMGMPILVVNQESGDYSNETRNALLRPLGRSNPVVVVDVRSGGAGTTTVLTQTSEEYRQIRELFGTGRPLLMTGPATWDLIFPLYMSIGTASVKRPGPGFDGPGVRLHSWDWVQVDPPPATTRVDLRTWGQVRDEWASWQTVVTDTVKASNWGDLLYPIGPGGARQAAWS